MLITTNFDSTEFQTSSGEFNLDPHQLLLLQAFRSWLGLPVIVVLGGGCRYPKWDAKIGKWNASAHNIYMPRKEFIHFKDDLQRGRLITLPATGTDIAVKGLDSWQLMDKVERFEYEQSFKHFDIKTKINIDDSPQDVSLITFDSPLFTGKGTYPDTNNQCCHVDCGDRSANEVLRAKRKRVKRWVRKGKKYIYAKQGESFKELRERAE